MFAEPNRARCVPGSDAAFFTPGTRLSKKSDLFRGFYGITVTCAVVFDFRDYARDARHHSGSAP
jgi:hypothetical protein